MTYLAAVMTGGGLLLLGEYLDGRRHYRIFGVLAFLMGLVILVTALISAVEPGPAIGLLS